MEMQCYICHNPKTAEQNRIAPPMIAIKNHYLTKGISKEDFIKEIQKFIKNPTAENSKMPGAVKKFGIMPKQYYSDKTIREIADYLYDNDVEKPKDYDENHGKKGQGKGMKKDAKNEANLHKNQTSFEENGLKIALETKSVLGKNLMGKIQKEGTLPALAFCNVKALPLTDSMSVANNVSIKRVSDKPRNPKNKATLEEEKYINIFKENAKNNTDSEPILVENSNSVTFYYPIITNSMCLQCHGNSKVEVSENTFASIKKMYPSDKAVGYDINQVRGIWNVTFVK
jgi:cytochrome c553